VTVSNPHHDRRWIILAVIGLAQLMVVLDATIVNVALPSAQQDLGFNDDSRQWIITAYTLAFGSLLLLGGRLGDLFGRKWAFIGGLLGFALASAVGGAAESFGVLAAARAAQGAFGAVLAPSALALLTTTFTAPEERGKAFGIFGAIAGGGAAVGLLLGGVLTELLSWRWCLYVNLLFAIPAALAALRLLVNQAQENRPRLDLLGAATGTAGLFALVYGFSNSETHSWTHPVTIIALAAAVVLLVTFASVERRVAHPLLPMRVIADRTRGGAYIAVAFAAIALFGVFLFLTYYLQQTKDYSPIETGLAFLPMPSAIVVTSTTVNIKLLARIGPRPLMTFGMCLGVIGMVWLAQIEVTSSYFTHVLPSLLVLGVGMGCVFAPAFQSATFGVAPTDAGIASAMVNVGQQVGGSIGTAMLSSIFASAVSAYAAGKAPTAATHEAASVHGYRVAFWVSAGIFALGAVVVRTLMRPITVSAPQQAGAAAD
jgi:EmrB/QacA subfamily drug resistance transporter